MKDNVPAKMSDLYEYSGFWPRDPHQQFWTPS